MNRTFKGFLERYCKELSGLDTSSLRRLVRAARENPRGVEPLFALAAVRGQLSYLLELSEEAWFHGDYRQLAGELERAESIEELLASARAPERYAAVLDAFRAQGDSLAAARRINGLMRPMIVEALEKGGVTRYRLCRDLGLNPGNVYAYLAGDDTKVSKQTARRMLQYAQSTAS